MIALVLQFGLLAGSQALLGNLVFEAPASVGMAS